MSDQNETAGSLRARPQEPGLFTKRLLDEIIDGILEGSDADNPTLCLEEFRDSILNLAPSGPQEPGDLISRAIEFIESDHDLDTRSEVLAKLREILSAPSGPLSDEPRETENQDGAAPVLGGDE